MLESEEIHAGTSKSVKSAALPNFASFGRLVWLLLTASFLAEPCTEGLVPASATESTGESTEFKGEEGGLGSPQSGDCECFRNVCV